MRGTILAQRYRYNKNSCKCLSGDTSTSLDETRVELRQIMSPPPYRADQVGSLIRPKYLLDANAASKQWLETEKDHRQEADDTSIKNKAKEAERKAIAEVVAEQVKRGIVPITSGEFERPIFYGGFFEAIDGLEVKFFDLSKFRTDFPTNVSLHCLLSACLWESYGNRMLREFHGAPHFCLSYTS